MFTTTANGALDLRPSGDGGDLYEGIPVRYFRRAWPRRFYGVAGLNGALAQSLKRYDLVHIHGLWNVTAWIAAYRAEAAGVPYVVSPRGMLEPAAMRRRSLLKSVAYSKIERKNLSRALFLHATSAAEAETLASCNLGVDVKLLPNGVETDDGDTMQGGAFRRKLGLKDDAALVVSLGRLHPIKRLDLLAGAFEQVLAKHANAHLVIAGPDEGGYRAEVEPLFGRAASNVHWVGKVEGEEKRALLADADVFVSCSDSESFGMSIAEAMLARTPVVVTRTCPWSDVITHDCGFWVEQDAGAIAEGVSQLLGDSARARAMGGRGRELILSKYSWERIAQEMADSYRAAIRRGAEGA